MAFAQVKNGVVTAIDAGQDDDTWIACGSIVSVGWTYDGENFSAPAVNPTPLTLQQEKNLQLVILSNACGTAIIAGFQSSALGTAYTYPSTQTDQINLAGSILASLLPSLPNGWTTVFWCKNSSGVWAMVAHTAAQIQQVGSDIKSFITSMQLQLTNLSAQVQAAQTVSAVQAITWSNPT